MIRVPQEHMSTNQRQRTESPSSEELDIFFQNFENAYRDARKERALRTPHLDVLQIFGLAYAELRHSDVLAWFLDSEAAHEQGPLFLNAVLRRFGHTPIAIERYHVDRERHARVDIACYCRGEFAIFIENKVRHGERDRQVKDMIASLIAVAREFQISPDDRFAVFLTEEGRDSVTGPTESNPEFDLKNLYPMSRIELFELFETALSQQIPRSPLLEGFLQSYLNSIQKIRS